MKIAPQVFNFECEKVRFVGTDEKPEWVGADVVNILYPAAIQITSLDFTI